MIALTSQAAMWFLPVVLPICFYVAWSDMRAMRIPNHAVIALFAAYVLAGLIALPLDVYGWRYVHLGAVLLVGMVLNAAGLMGAGDAKFAAAAAPFVAFNDLQLILVIFAATLLAAWSTHRLAKHTGLRRLAPEWDSWEQAQKKFPMGLALGGCLSIYLLLAAFYGD